MVLPWLVSAFNLYLVLLREFRCALQSAPNDAPLVLVLVGCDTVSSGGGTYTTVWYNAFFAVFPGGPYLVHAFDNIGVGEGEEIASG